MYNPAADRNLLLGVLALQLDFTGQDALIAALHTWVFDKARPLLEDPALAPLRPRPEFRGLAEALAAREP